MSVSASVNVRCSHYGCNKTARFACGTDCETFYCSMDCASLAWVDGHHLSCDAKKRDRDDSDDGYDGLPAKMKKLTMKDTVKRSTTDDMDDAAPMDDGARVSSETSEETELINGDMDDIAPMDEGPLPMLRTRSETLTIEDDHDYSISLYNGSFYDQVLRWVYIMKMGSRDYAIQLLVDVADRGVLGEFETIIIRLTDVTEIDNNNTVNTFEVVTASGTVNNSDTHFGEPQLLDDDELRELIGDDDSRKIVSGMVYYHPIDDPSQRGPRVWVVPYAYHPGALDTGKAVANLPIAGGIRGWAEELKVPLTGRSLMIRIQNPFNPDDPRELVSVNIMYRVGTGMYITSHAEVQGFVGIAPAGEIWEILEELVDQGYTIVDATLRSNPDLEYAARAVSSIQSDDDSIVSVKYKFDVDMVQPDTRLLVSRSRKTNKMMIEDLRLRLHDDHEILDDDEDELFRVYPITDGGDTGVVKLAKLVDELGTLDAVVEIEVVRIEMPGP